MGPAGSGKTYFVINTLLKTHKYKYLCVDDINLPYDDARSELKLQIAKSIENNENFITEGTGGKNSDEIYKFLKYLQHECGYDVTVYYKTITVESALANNNKRNRKLHHNLVLSIYNESIKNMDLWKDFDCIYV